MALIDFFERAFALDKVRIHAEMAGVYFGKGRAYCAIGVDPPRGVHLSDETREDLEGRQADSKRAESEQLKKANSWRDVAERRTQGVLAVAFVAGVGTLLYDVLRWG